MSLKQSLEKIINETKDLLWENDEWRNRYNNYANKITENLDFIESNQKTFHQWKPLTVYLNTTSALNAKKSVKYEIRYYGQTVAKLTGFKSGRHKLSTKGFDETNLRDFDCAIKLDGVNWAGNEAKEFRKYFKERKTSRNEGNNKKNEEHRLESLWLSELQKTKNKILPYAKPVEIGKARFPMPTPISASNHKKVKYSGYYGGGIDILARVGTGGVNTYLCIIELKDENVKREPPKYAIGQAVAYTTFIRELLRSECGNLWWKIFGFNSEIPKRLNLYAVCLMPSNSLNDYSFKDIELHIESDIIKLNYIYFIEKNNKIIEVDTSLEFI